MKAVKLSLHLAIGTCVLYCQRYLLFKHQLCIFNAKRETVFMDIIGKMAILCAQGAQYEIHL